MITMRSRLAAVCGALLWSAIAIGQSVQTVPPAFDSVAGTNGNSIPIANFSAGTYQVIYAADQLSGIPVGSVITGMQLRLRNVDGPFPSSTFVASQYDVTLAGSSLTPATMSGTFATNMLDPVLVRSGALAVVANSYPVSGNPRTWGPLIPFTTGFAYQGGALVIEWRVTSPSSTFSSYADANLDASSNRYMSTSSVSSTTGSPTSGGVIVRLTFTPPPTDLTRGVTKVIVGENYAGVNAETADGVLMWTAPFSQQAVASANQFDTIGPGSNFVGMAWRQRNNTASAWPTAIANFAQYDVQLSRSVNGPGALSTTVATNVGADAVMVRSGALSFGIGAFAPKASGAVAPFGPEVSFANPYAYRGGPLLSVIRHSGQSSGSAGYFDGLGFGESPDLEARQTSSAGAATIASTSSYMTTRYSVDAGTSSPLNQLTPGADAVGTEVTPVIQTVLSASELKYIPLGSVIDSLWLRQIASAGAGPATNVTATSFELAVSSATNQPGGMSTNFAANEGADKVLVHQGPLAVAAGTMPAGSTGNFGKIVQFQKNFVYKGGPLCVTIRHTGLSALMGAPEAVFGSASTNRTTYSFTPGSATGAFYNPTYTGTAMKLGYIPSVMTPNNLATAEGADGINFPGDAAYTGQVILAADQLRSIDVGSAITGMSLRQSSSGGSTSFPAVDTLLSRYDVTFAPATNPPLSASNTFASNNGPGVVTVRSGPMTVPANAFPYSGSSTVPGQNAWYVPFDRAYVYTGGDLCITIRSQGQLFASQYFDVDGSQSARGVLKYDTTNANSLTATGTSGPLAIRLAFTARAFCPWDLNNDGVVEDSDFVIFLAAYNILDCTDGAMPQGCPADFNYDRVVDDADFTLFVIAYNALVCP